MMRVFIGFLGVLSLLLAGCGEDRALFARVGEVEITQQDFAAFVERLSPGLRSTKQGRAADREHLQSMIDQQLMFAEARTLGIDTSPEIINNLRELTRQRLVERYRGQIIFSKISLQAEDIDRAFVELGFNRERLFNRILVRTRKDLEEVGRGLRQGQPFEELARRFAANDLFAKQGDGVVGWIGRTQAERRFAIAPEIFMGLPSGQVAEPVQLAGGWQVFRFVEDREADLINYLEEVTERLQREQMRASEEEEFERLRHQYGVQLEQRGVEILLGRAGKKPGEDELNRPLYTYDGGEISVAEGLAGLQAVGAQDLVLDPEQVDAQVGRLLLPVRLFEAEAEKRGWTQEANFTEWREHKRRALILDHLFARVTAEVAPSEAEIEAYYNAHKDRYRSQEEVFVHEIWMAEEDAARAIHVELEAGADIADLLDRPGVRSHADVEGHGIREHGWEMRLLRLYKPRFPELVEAAFNAEVGELVGPIKSKGGYAVFRVLRREGGKIQLFDEARRSAFCFSREGHAVLFDDAFDLLDGRYFDQFEGLGGELGADTFG